MDWVKFADGWFMFVCLTWEKQPKPKFSMFCELSQKCVFFKVILSQIVRENKKLLENFSRLNFFLVTDGSNIFALFDQ